MLGGRGAGKTRTGAEWVRGIALGQPDFAEPASRRIALVGETFADARDVMIEGPSGLLGLHRARERPAWSPSPRRLEWPNGAVAHAFSAEDPESCADRNSRPPGPTSSPNGVIADETWDMLQFGLRLGARPRQMVTTTPRPIPLLKRLLGDPRIAVIAGADLRQRRQSRAGLPRQRGRPLRRHAARPPGTRRRDRSRIGRTRCGRARSSKRCASMKRRRWRASWLRSIRRPPRANAPMPAASSPPAWTRRRCVCAGGRDAAAARPAAWATKAVALYRRLQADALVVEINQGGEMVESRAPRSRPGGAGHAACERRAASTCAPSRSRVLYAQGRVRHVGADARAGGRDVRFRPGRSLVRPLAGPARRPGMGAHRIDVARPKSAAASRALNAQVD